MRDDDVTQLLGDHRVPDSRPDRVRVSRSGVIDEIGDHAVTAVDAWVASRAGSIEHVSSPVSGHFSDVYDLPASAFDTDR